MYRLGELIRLDRKLYHTNDLAILWGISNKNTLYTTIKRYIGKGVLYPIYKGLYSTVAISQLNPLELGIAVIHKFTYLSTESILFTAGIISQKPSGYTFVSSLSKNIAINGTSFIYRQLADKYLHNSSGLANQNGVFVASTERAIADLKYFNPMYHFDLPDNIDWGKVNAIEQEVGYI